MLISGCSFFTVVLLVSIIGLAFCTLWGSGVFYGPTIVIVRCLKRAGYVDGFVIIVCFRGGLSWAVYGRDTMPLAVLAALVF
jgi:hypothetical protein